MTKSIMDSACRLVVSEAFNRFRGRVVARPRVGERFGPSCLKAESLKLHGRGFGGGESHHRLRRSYGLPAGRAAKLKKGLNDVDEALYHIKDKKISYLTLFHRLI